MTRVTVQRTIDAPINAVFRAVTDIDTLPKVSPEIVGIELLSESRTGAGTRFRETRRMKNKDVVTEIDFTEFVENDRARTIADGGGAVWNTLFTVRPSGGQTELEIEMVARPYRLMPKIMIPIMRGFFKKGMEKYIDAVRNYCEQSEGGH